MRFLTKKIHRAYPELDKFDDEVCKRYIKRARRLENTWKLWGLQISSIPISLLLWASVSGVVQFILFFGQAARVDWFAHLVQNPVLLIFTLIQWSGYIFVPAVICLHIRDRWLHRCIRKQLTGVQCGACGYSLLGLSINNDNDTPSVHCPECGHHLILKDMGLTQADIDPNHQPATP